MKSIQSKDIHELLALYFADGFTVDNLCQITGVSSEIVTRCINHDNITHDETIKLGKVLSFLGMLYMVDTDEITYLRDSVSALENFYHISHNNIANYLGISCGEFEVFLENPKNYPDGYKILIKLMHFRTVLLQRIE